MCRKKLLLVSWLLLAGVASVRAQTSGANGNVAAKEARPEVGLHLAQGANESAAARRYAPSRWPDRIVLTWTGDPATSQSVTWRTDGSVTSAIAELSVATDHAADLKPVRVTARTETLVSNLSTAHYHQADFSALTPDTLYAYRVGDGVNWSAWLHFRTASREMKPFSFLVFGDSQNDLTEHWTRVVREAYRAAPEAALVLHVGDLVGKGENDAEWGEWFGATSWLNDRVPVVAAVGNHEQVLEGRGPTTERLWSTKAGGAVPVTVEFARDPAVGGLRGVVTGTTPEGQRAQLEIDAKGLIMAVDETFTRLTGFQLDDVKGRSRDTAPLRDRVAVPGVAKLTAHWRAQFAYPTNQGAPAGVEETCYTFDYQGVRFVVLDSNREREPQTAWLRDVLAKNPQRWTVVMFHHPVFAMARGRDNTWLRETWKPVLDEFKVDLVLTGHDHTYGRTGLVRDAARAAKARPELGTPYDAAIGTVYVVSVSGPKMYGITDDSFAVRAADDTQLFQVIRVDGDTLRYEARTATGRLYDAFTLEKRAGAANRLIESEADLGPERRRK